MTPGSDMLFPPLPLGSTETKVVVLLRVSRTKMSDALLRNTGPVPVTRYRESNATYRPSAEIDGRLLLSDEATLFRPNDDETKVVVLVRVSRT